MQNIKTFILSVCIALIVIGFILKLSPSKGQKPLKGILSMILILLILAPLTGAVKVELPQFSKNNIASTDYSNLITNTTINLLKNRIEETLTQNQISFNDVIINSKSVNGSTEITDITVYAINKEDVPKIKKLLLNQLNLEVAVAIYKAGETN